MYCIYSQNNLPVLILEYRKQIFQEIIIDETKRFKIENPLFVEKFSIYYFSIYIENFISQVMENRKLQLILAISRTMPSQCIHPRRKSRAVSSFLKKTYDILEDSVNYYAIKWAHDGVGFVVTKQEQFSKQILPKYFKHSNYSSFVRQLNMYNFHKIREANFESHFHHDCFRRNNRSLLSEIKRKPEKKKRKNDQSDDQIKSKQDAELSVNHQIDVSQHFYTEQGLQIKSWKEDQKKGYQNTRHVCVSEKQQQIDTPSSRQRVSIQNILCQENDDDKISINNELVERFPRCPTKEIFYPSNNNIYPFPYGAPISNFNIFF